MKIGLTLLDAAAEVRTLRGLHEWLLDVISDARTSEQARHICTIFACAIEPLISLALIDADTSDCIWATFKRFRLELAYGASKKAPEANIERSSSDFRTRKPGKIVVQSLLHTSTLRAQLHQDQSDLTYQQHGIILPAQLIQCPATKVPGTS